jgi:hypothetical protein
VGRPVVQVRGRRGWKGAGAQAAAARGRSFSAYIFPPLTLPVGELRLRTKCGAWKLSRDRATKTDTDLLCFAVCWNLNPRRRAARGRPGARWWGGAGGGSGFAAQGSGRAPSPRCTCSQLVGGALVMPRKTWSGPVLCFLPRNFPIHRVAMES